MGLKILNFIRIDRKYFGHVIIGHLNFKLSAEAALFKQSHPSTCISLRDTVNVKDRQQMTTIWWEARR